MRIRKVRASLFKIEVPETFAGANWHWAELAEIALIVGKTPVQVYNSFKALARPFPKNHSYPGMPMHWVRSDRICCNQDGFHVEPVDLSDPLYFPAGWAQDVLRAHELGVVRVERVEKSPMTSTSTSSSLWAYNMARADAWDRIEVYAVGYDSQGQPVPGHYLLG